MNRLVKGVLIGAALGLAAGAAAVRLLDGRETSNRVSQAIEIVRDIRDVPQISMDETEALRADRFASLTTLVFLMAIGPFMGWKRGDVRAALQRLIAAGVAAIGAAIIALWIKLDGPILAPLGLAAGVWLLVGTLIGLRTGATPHRVIVFGRKAVAEQEGGGDYAPLVREVRQFFQTGVAPGSAREGGRDVRIFARGRASPPIPKTAWSAFGSPRGGFP